MRRQFDLGVRVKGRYTARTPPTGEVIRKIVGSQVIVSTGDGTVLMKVWMVCRSTIRLPMRRWMPPFTTLNGIYTRSVGLARSNYSPFEIYSNIYQSSTLEGGSKGAIAPSMSRQLMPRALKIDLEVHEKMILWALEYTPLPKDLRLLIVSYWRPTRYLAAYSDANKREKYTGEKDKRIIQWGSIPYDSRIKLPPSMELQCRYHIMIHFRSGFLLEYLTYLDPEYVWHLRYYPDIHSTNYVNIPVTSDQQLAVVGKHRQTLIAMCSDESKYQLYSFEQKIWIDQPKPNCVTTDRFEVHWIIRGDGLAAIRDAYGYTYLYDGTTWTKLQRNDKSLLMVSDWLCYRDRRKNRTELTFESIATGKLIRTLIHDEEPITSTGDGRVVIYHDNSLSLYDPMTNESTDVTNDDNRSMDLEDLKMIKLFPVST